MTLKILQNAYRQLQRDPVEGFLVEPHEDDFFKWTVWIEGPRPGVFENGIFEMELVFPRDFPMSPPDLRFVSEFWHPNVYHDGRVCISILHPPIDDPMSGELPQERWLPTQTVSTIILSVLSILDAPNFSSPANVDASVEWKQSPEAFLRRTKHLVEKARTRIPAHIKIPHPESNPEERAKALERHRILNDTSSVGDMLEEGGTFGADDVYMVDLGDGSEDSFDYNADYSDDEFNYATGDEPSPSSGRSGDSSKNNEKKKKAPVEAKPSATGANGSGAPTKTKSKDSGGSSSTSRHNSKRSTSGSRPDDAKKERKPSGHSKGSKSKSSKSSRKSHTKSTETGKARELSKQSAEQSEIKL